VRSAWRDVPASVRDAVDAVLGAAVVSTHGVSGGFSPGPAVRAVLDDGRAVFVKAAGTALNPLSPGMHRREAVVLGVLPIEVPAPRLLGVVDDGEWVALCIEWVEGRAPAAGDARDVARFLAIFDRVAAATAGTPVPGLRPFAEAHRELLGHWAALAADPLDGLDDWSVRHLDRLVTLEALAPDASAGPDLVHVDARTDNAVLATSGPDGDVLVDWPAAALGAAWIDLVCLLPALHLDGGPSPAAVFDAHAVARRADAQAVDAVVAAVAGFLTRQALLPAPPGLPTLRAFQAAQGAIARHWLDERLRTA
jgi:aminoglycoside phosphotransferase (APT) family kinase protein